MLLIITTLGGSACARVALGIYLAYVPYEEEFQYLAFILAILVPLIVIREGLSLGVDVRHRGARVFTSFSFPIHVHTVLKPYYWTITLVMSQTSTLITGESSLIPSSGRCPTISGYVAKLLAISALYSAWSIMVKFALVAQCDLIFSGGGDTDGGSDDEGSAAANSVMHASADGDRGVWC
ncbi:hypothetical protein Tco_0255720 [Tanacetum coccineum]